MSRSRTASGFWRAAGWGAVFLACALLAAWVLRRQFGGTGFIDIATALRAQPAGTIAAALLLTVVSFAALSVYDLLGVRIVAPGRVAPGVALLAGATANAISNTLGFHALTGSAVRARIYLRHGLTGGETARVVSLSWLALGLGFLSMLAVAECLGALTGTGGSPFVGAGLCAVLLVFLAWTGSGKRELRLFKFRQPMPTARMAAVQMLIGAVETAASIAALYVLLPPDLAPPFGRFAVGCIAAVALGLLAHAPGGIGVFEASITALVAGAGRADLLAALLLYRAIYNFLPFLVSVAVLGLLALRRRALVNSTAGTS